MPELIFRDLAPDVEDVPCETWEDIDPEAVIQLMISRLDEDPGDVGLIALASLVRVRPPTQEQRQVLQEVAPELMALLDEEPFDDDDPL